MKKQDFVLAFFACILTVISGYAQIPSGYYDNTFGKKKDVLKTAMKTIIRPHTQRSYGDLWTDFQQTDKRADGKVWDMYSDCSFIFVDKQCGSSIGNVCSCYNREHSFPASWFSSNYPMYTDLFHLYPTDGKVNNARGNFPFGETTNGTTYGTGKVGNSSFSGYSGTVFEPANEYKGDFARSYFYMVTCYEDIVTGWSSDMLNKTTYPSFQTWAINLLLKWSRQDPVSAKEIARNNAVYSIQDNRNPFIDYPELAEYIWGDSIIYAFNPNDTDISEMEWKPLHYVYDNILYLEDLPNESSVQIFTVYGTLVADERTVSDRCRVFLPEEHVFIVRIFTPDAKIKILKIINKR